MNHPIAKPILCTLAMGFAFSVAAASAITKPEYQGAKDQAESTYKAAREQCNSLSSNGKDVCIAQAKAARVHAESDAEAQYKNTPSAIEDARKSEAQADYDVNKAKCDGLAGNDHDVCVKQAKATLIGAEADAKAARKTGEAHADAISDKNAADYKVALEQCNGLAGTAKESCVADAKSRYGM